jgi:hypothetical protein
MALGQGGTPGGSPSGGRKNMLKEVLAFVATLGCFFASPSALVSAAMGVQPSDGIYVHKIQVTNSDLGHLILAEGGSLVADYGGFQLYEVAQISQFSPNPRIAIRDEYNWILLNVAHLDTRRPEVQARRKAVGSFQGKRMHLVHFAGPILPAWRDSLISRGVQIIAYIPHNAYLIYGSAESLLSIQVLAAKDQHIQWEGAYEDTYKIHSRAHSVDAAGQPQQIGTGQFAIQLVGDEEANRGTLALLERLKLEPISRRESLAAYVNLIVRLGPMDLSAVASQPDVISIQPYRSPKKVCERQAQIVAGNFSGGLLTGPGYLSWLTSKGFTQAQFDTSGFAVDVSDSGIDDGTTAPGHFGLYTQGMIGNTSRVLYARLVGTRNSGSTLAGCDGHGTINAHIIAGYDDLSGFPFSDVTGYHYGLGICPFVKLGSSVIFDPDNFTSPNFNNLQSHAYQAGVRISNNSWGSAVNGVYDMNAQNFDALVRDAQPSGSANQEMVMVFAAGNEGPNGQTIDSPGDAKNVICVGGAENQQAIGGPDGSGIDDNQADDGEDIISFSSRGPCADLRHKPDLVAPCTHVSGGVGQAANPGADGTALACYTGDGVSGGPGDLFFPLGQQFYTTSSGTSHAAPCISGGCALLRQYFINNFSNPPSPAMTKAYLMNSARYMTGLYANDTLWSDTQGMGEMNLGMAFDATPRLLRDQLAEDLFIASGQVRLFSGTIWDTNKPFRVTLAWTDAPGSTTADAYNNDLDLTVTAGGHTYLGNVFAGAFSTSGGSPDARNNVESVFLPSGIGGSFVVSVSAANVNSDGVPGNAYDLDQDFALVVYNAIETTPPSITVEPTNQTAAAGAKVNFQVTASGTPPLIYQWFFNGAYLPGERGSMLALTNVQANQMGKYWVTVTNASGWSSSSEAWLKVLVPPNISGVTASANNATVSFTSVVGLSYTLQYKNVWSDPLWISVSLAVTGNGGTVSLTDPNPTTPGRFYRILCN